MTGSFLSSWQLFLADSIAIDKTLQTSVDAWIRDQIPAHKDSSPSRLSFFVSLSNRANADTSESKEESQEAKRKSDQSKAASTEDISKFKSVILSVATVGLTLHPISSYYPESHPTQTFTMTQTQTTTGTAHRATRVNTHSPHTHTSPQQHQASKSSSPLEVSVRRKAISVLESMVTGFDLRKWFISPASSSSSSSGCSQRSSGGGGSKVRAVTILIK